ncbi:MAG: YciI family protein [SAR324 cluster bacterium]|jgi:uncharacterized protein YciI|nr:hypothetical protein [Deltaproteobacteria bacterium]MDE0906963.1 YciI family protein [SAR324 cluster bacterium]HIF68073.1 YciI family protein [Candidatus Lambdaproteobacteria bacterium]MAZ74194.1 hypothetical protein [Deltaproteobacteria bacterium]MEC7417438.1 YciI family protein [SAR324 cluster bacterium]|tara:strand:+ start:107 stop:415 length:309 start_codon:yes stop_codon:yes gene_type:complete
MYFIFIGKDKPGMLETRKATRATHRKHVRNSDGPVRLMTGGPLAGKDGEMNGTFLMFEAPDHETAQEFLDADPYHQAGMFASRELRAFHEAAELPVALTQSN